MSDKSESSFCNAHRITIRVQYNEIDGQGRVHNSHYLNYFERGRVEMLRENNISYRELEETGLMLVVKTMHVDFHVPAQFDDELELFTILRHCHGARVEHAYKLIRTESLEDGSTRNETLIVTGHSIIACVDREGKVRRLPKILQLGLSKE